MKTILLALVLVAGPWAAGAASADEHDRHYCEFFLGSGLDDLVKIDQLMDVLNSWLYLREQTNLQSVDHQQQLRILSLLRWPAINQFVEDNHRTPQRLTLLNLARVYFENLRDGRLRWAAYPPGRTAHWEKILNEASQTFDEYVQQNFPEDIPMADLILILRRWLPATPTACRLALWMVSEDDEDHSSAFAALMMGSDAHVWQKIEDKDPTRFAFPHHINPGASGSQNTTPLKTLPQLWRALRPRRDAVFLDFGAGDGRVGASWLTYHPHARFIGLEVFAPRLARAEQIAAAMGFSPQRFQMQASDLSDPYLEVAPADYYYLFNPVTPSILDNILSHLSQRRRFRLIFYSLNLFKEHANDPSIRPLLRHVPGWLRLERKVRTRVHGAEKTFFIYKSRR